MCYRCVELLPLLRVIPTHTHSLLMLRHSRVVHPCFFVLRCPLSRCPPLILRADLSTPSRFQRPLILQLPSLISRTLLVHCKVRIPYCHMSPVVGCDALKLESIRFYDDIRRGSRWSRLKLRWSDLFYISQRYISETMRYLYIKRAMSARLTRLCAC